MANVCSNWVEIRGEEEDIKSFIELVGKEFDFKKVIPTKTDKVDEANKKWGSGSIAFDPEFSEDGDYAEWNFWTKWSPPSFIYEKLCKMFPNIFIYWRYEEPGCDLYGYLNNGDFK